DAERKQVIIDELAMQGVIWQALIEDVSQELDPFDLICHIVFDRPPLTRKERANKVKKRNYFTAYSETAQKVLNALLDGYADTGVQAIEGKDALKANSIIPFGRPLEIARKSFGGAQKYNAAITELETQLYQNEA
ncbi:MAG: DEAD/DEAH box helicase, partial [Methyloprofundus sp.]|nr:DEAD/DEAH box helicase [Methyloprofundus sp.]